MSGQPLLLMFRKRAAGYAHRIVFAAKEVDIIWFINRELSLSYIEIRKKVCSVFVDAKEVIGCTERVKQFRVITSVGTVPFCCKHIHLIIVEGLEERIIIIEKHDLCLHAVILQERFKRVRHGAVQHTDALSFQRRGIDGDALIGDVLYQVVGLITHRRIRVTYKFFALFFPRKTGKYVNIAIQQFLI